MTINALNTVERFSFQCCLFMEFSEGKHSAPSLEDIVASCNDG
jgi:hypothetical protein